MEVLCLVGVIRATTVAVVARLPDAAVLLEVMKVNIMTFFQLRPVRVPFKGLRLLVQMVVLLYKPGTITLKFVITPYICSCQRSCAH